MPEPPIGMTESTGDLVPGGPDETMTESAEGYRLTQGPLPKSIYTVQLEMLTRKLLDNTPFKIIKQSDRTLIAFDDDDNYSYDATSIFKYANLEHLQFEPEDFDAYDQHLRKYSAKASLRKKFSQPEYKNKYLDLHISEMLAINEYTSNSGSITANALLRGMYDFSGGRYDFSDCTKTQIRKDILNAVFCGSGLSKIPEQTVSAAYRREDLFDRAVHEQRKQAVKTKIPSQLSGFVSTSAVVAESWLKKMVEFKFTNLRGKDVSLLSEYPAEREYLIPPTQIQITSHVLQDGLDKFTASPVTDLASLAPEKLFDTPAMARTKALEEFIKELSALKIKGVGAQASFLRQVDKDSWNALMIAIRYHPEAVPQILQAMTGLEVGVQALILKQDGKDHWNALMIAVRYNPAAVPQILKVMTNLEQEDQSSILKRVNKNRWNALMVAACSDPETVPQIIVAMKNLKLEDQASILKQVNQDGCNALKLADKYNRSELVKILTEYTEFVALQQSINKFEKSVEKLRRLSERNPGRYQKAFSEAEILHKTLNAHFVTYQNSEKSPDDRRKLQSEWTATIVGAKNTKAIKFPGVKANLWGMLVCVASIIIPPYGIWRAIRNFSQNKSMLFISGTEQKLNVLKHAVREIYKPPLKPQPLFSGMVTSTVLEESSVEAADDDKKIAILEAEKGKLLRSDVQDSKALPHILAVILSLANLEKRMSLLTQYIEALKLKQIFFNNEMIKKLIQSATKELSLDQKALELKVPVKENWNALMEAVSRSPKELDTILSIMNRLEMGDRTRILKQVNKDGLNVLMIAVQNKPKVVAQILLAIKESDRAAILEGVDKNTLRVCLQTALKTAITKNAGAVLEILSVMKTLDEVDREVILEGVDKSALKVCLYKALAKAITNKTKAVPEILLAMEALGDADKAAILKHCAKDHWNALYIAVKSNPKAVPQILKAINALKKEDQAFILKQTTKDRWNPLMFAARYSPEAVPQILEAMKDFEAEDKAAILKNSTKDGWNALMLAFSTHPEAGLQILIAIQKLGKDEEAAILKTIDKSALKSCLQKALTEAITANSQALPQILLAMDALGEADKAAMLEEVKTKVFDSFILAIRGYNTGTVNTILLAMDVLGGEAKADLLKRVDGSNNNALMVAAGINPTLVARILSAMRKEDRAFILKQFNNDGWNALMFAVRSFPQEVPQILETMKDFEAEDKASILKQSDKGGWNALAIAASSSPQAVPQILEAMHDLEAEDKASILKQRITGWNAIRLALSTQPEVAPQIFLAILKLKQEEQDDILEGVDKSALKSCLQKALTEAITTNSEAILQIELAMAALGEIIDIKAKFFDSLTLAIQSNHSATVKTILLAMDALGAEDKLDILKRVNKGGWNALMFAVMNSPEAVPQILIAIQKFDKSEQKDILKLDDGGGWNVLIIAAKFNFGAVTQILKFMDSLELTDLELAEILTHVNPNGFNALLSAIEQPKGIPLILLAMQKLKEEDRASILKKTDNTDGLNALMYAARSVPEAVPQIIEAMKGLKLENQLLILNQVDKKGQNALKLAGIVNSPGIVKMLTEYKESLDLQLSLEKLDESIKAISSPTSTIDLYTELSEALNTHLASPNKDLNARKQLHRVWTTVIIKFQSQVSDPIFAAMAGKMTKNLRKMFNLAASIAAVPTELTKPLAERTTDFKTRYKELIVPEGQEKTAQDCIAEFFNAHHESSDDDRPSSVIESVVEESTDEDRLRAIIQDAQKHDNRSRDALVRMGWMNPESPHNLTGEAPPIAHYIMTPETTGIKP